MNEPKGRLQIVAAPASEWCDPDTGVCHIDETGRAEALEETAAHNTPSATER
jgi:hypothetical protein